MNHLLLFENFDQEKAWVDFYRENPNNYLPKTITWIRNSFFDKIDSTKEKMLEFEDRIDGVFNKPLYKINQNLPSLSSLQLGIASESSYECLFTQICDLIISNCQDNELLEKTIDECYSEKRFQELLDRMRTRKTSPFSSHLYYPYYKFEGSFQVDKDVEKEVILREQRFINYCNGTIKEIFPEWKCNIQLRPGLGNVHFWVHLVDKTNNIN